MTAFEFDRPDFLDQARRRLPPSGCLAGVVGDFAYVVLDAARYDMTIVECAEGGLTHAVARMPTPPTAVINGQFMAGIRLQAMGQVVRERRLIHDDRRAKRCFIAQHDSPAARIVVGEGDPWSRAFGARVAMGGLGPVLRENAPVATTTEWARSLYDMGAETGRGCIGFDQRRKLVLLLVQRNLTPFDDAVNAASLGQVRGWLQAMGIDDAVCNDGSDSEALYAEGEWLVEPGRLKDRAMSFAVGFVDRRQLRRLRMLAIDGTDTADAEAFATGLDRSPILNYMPENLAETVRRRTGALAMAGRGAALDVWQAGSGAGLRACQGVFESSGTRGAAARIVYVSSHASRHGQLYYHRGGGHRGPRLVFADPWSRDFAPAWDRGRGPLWIVMAGCAALSLRYSRLKALTPDERDDLRQRHRDIHGRRAEVPRLTDQHQAAFIVHHPGWRWFDRYFRRSGLRGVLGYWYRSPGGEAGDVEIVRDFSAQLGEGKPLLDAWRDVNYARRRVLGIDVPGAKAAWAAMVRSGCEGDTLAMLERANVPRSEREFRYLDMHVDAPDGLPLVQAYARANVEDASTRIGAVTLRYNERYDRVTLKADEPVLGVRPDTDRLLLYDDAVGPSR